MPVDANIFNQAKTLQDYQLQNLQGALVAAQAKKAMTPDLEELGKQAFIKMAQGLPVGPNEAAAFMLVDKPQMYLDAAGNVAMKPSMSDRLKSAGIQVPEPRGMGMPQISVGLSQNSSFAQAMGGAPQQGSGDFLADVAPQSQQPVNEWDIEYQKQLTANAGNPKAQQTIRETYAKRKLDMTADEAKAATYADRMLRSNQVLTDEAGMKAYSLPLERTLDFINPFGAGLNSSKYQEYKQAQGDFTTAKLRQESGAVINPSEFATDKELYYPQVGDSAEVLAQKARNRETVLRGLQRQAGPAYKQPELPQVPQKPKTKQEFNAMRDPRVAKAKAAGYSDEEIQQYLSGK